MLGFKKYVSEGKRADEQGVLGPDGVPSVVILNRRKRKLVQGQLGPDGVPSAVVLNRRKPTANLSEGWDSKWSDTNDNHHIGKNTDEVHEHLTGHDKTLPVDIPHVKNYTDDSSSLNRTLYHEHNDGIKSDRIIRGHDTKALDTALNRNKLHSDLHVYSGVRFHPGTISARHPDRHVHLPAYTSASINKGTAKDFAEEDDDGHTHILHVHLPKGHKGKYVAKHSYTPHEQEFMIPRGTTVKVHHTPTMHTDEHGTTYAIWHSTVVDKKNS